MRLFDLISMTLRNLLRRKARTLLTMMGVVVGTCAIVVMVSLGIAMNVGFDKIDGGIAGADGRPDPDHHPELR